jgi:hypothetical protein
MHAIVLKDRIGMEHHVLVAVTDQTGTVSAVLLAQQDRSGMPPKVYVSVPQDSNGTEVPVLLLALLEW